MSATIDPHARFPMFYSNPAIRLLATHPRWTVSGQLGDGPDSKGKAPIDVRALLDTGRIRGAWKNDENCLVTLDELAHRLPEAANSTFYLHGQTDGLLVIDVEPGCPSETAANLLALPDILYCEISMSGRGYHLVAALPKNFYELTAAATKRVLREAHGWYEILIDHWVTFTRKPIGEEVISLAGNIDLKAAQFASVDELYASLAETAQASSSAATEVTTPTQPPEIKAGQQVIDRTLALSAQRFKTLEQFGGDQSRYEFSILGVLYRQMRVQLVLFSFVHRSTYSDSDHAWLLYQAAMKVLPSRPKHNERRNGRPFLLDRAAAMVAAASSS